MAYVDTPSKSHSTEPTFMPSLNVRRYGRLDFERFNQNTAPEPHFCVSSETIGDVEIQCHFRWSEARWGVVGPKRYPAGIIFIDITIIQPSEHTLSNANILITLSGEESFTDSSKKHRSMPIKTSLDSDLAVRITEFGPRRLIGPKSSSFETRETSLQPTLGAGGWFELGGMGVRKTISKERTDDSWTFKGNVKAAKDGQGLRSLLWELKNYGMESHPFSTAFAFEHSNKPVIMQVEIEGRLKSRMRRTKHKMLRFHTKSRDKDQSMIVKMDLSSVSSMARGELDGLISGLDSEMEQRNLLRLATQQYREPVQSMTGQQPTTSEFAYEEIERILPSRTTQMEEDIGDLARLLTEPNLREALAISESMQRCSSRHSVGSARTLVNDDNDRKSPEEILVPKNLVWRMRDVVALLLARWLMAVLNAITNQPMDPSSLRSAGHPVNEPSEKPQERRGEAKREVQNDSLLSSNPRRRLRPQRRPLALLAGSNTPSGFPTIPIMNPMANPSANPLPIKKKASSTTTNPFASPLPIGARASSRSELPPFF